VIPGPNLRPRTLAEVAAVLALAALAALAYLLERITRPGVR
jgi:hypothetical protein